VPEKYVPVSYSELSIAATDAPQTFMEVKITFKWVA